MSLRLFHYDEIDSTQNEAMRLLDRNEQPPFLVTTDSQTAGRGRMDRTWHFEKNRSLAFSVVGKMKTTKLGALSLIVGYSIAKFLEPVRLEIKWPNDLILENQKVGGILIESRSVGEWADVVIGVGINLLPLHEATYASIQKKVDAIELASFILDFVENVQIRGGFSSLRKEFEEKLWRNSPQLKILGVTDEGFLVTEENGKMELKTNGEIALV